ncbi:MAG: ribosome-binding factor A [Candidatus Kaiserbacteria bacterium]|nr:MAG: ribosome-binding factor A [Candidatus Kaiserbacteria bacterium]
MSSRREIQVAETLQHLAGEYFVRESNRESLMTITRAEIAPNLKSITIFFSVLPENFEEKVLDFAKRSRSDFREYVKKHSFLHPVPMIDFEIDYGEKNRQRIDDLTRS